MIAATRIIGVETRVAGDAVVAESDLRRKLGKNAWHVWQVLCARRDRAGLTHVSGKGIFAAKGCAPMNRWHLPDALRRLEAAALVERLGWREASVPWRNRMVTRKVYFRRVLGAPMLALVGRERQYAVPRATKEWLSEAVGHGGKRMGAGRPAKKWPVEEGIARIQAPSTPIQAPSTPHRIQAPSPSMFTKNTVSKRVTSRTGDSLSENQAAAEPAAGLLFDLETPGVGSVLGGAATRTPPMLSTPLRGVPSYPGISVVAPAVVPDPIKLADDHSEEYRVKLLASAYRGAVEKQYRKPCHFMKRFTRRAASFGLLVKAAALLQAFDVAPAAWCIWSVRRWYLARTHQAGYVAGAPVPLPPVGVVFSARSIEDRLADSDRRYVVEDSAVGGRLIFGKTHKLLLKRYGEMRGALIAAGPNSRAAVVERFFPGTTYDDMVDAARVEAVEIRNKLEDRVARGEVIW